MVEEARELVRAIIDAHVRAHEQTRRGLDLDSWQRISSRAIATCHFVREDRQRALFETLERWDCASHRRDIEEAVRRDFGNLLAEIGRDLRIRKFECRSLAPSDDEAPADPDDPWPVEFPGIGRLITYPIPRA
jgi:hypothetical protein